MTAPDLNILIKKLNKLAAGDIEKVVFKKTMQRSQDKIEDMQRFQMQQGLDSDGDVIGYLRSSIYARAKKNKGGIAPVGHVDLKDTGAFQSKIKARIVHGAVLLDSSDSKTDDLVEKYGEDIFGFNEESKEILGRILAPVAAFELKRYIDAR